MMMMRRRRRLWPHPFRKWIHAKPRAKALVFREKQHTSEASWCLASFDTRLVRLSSCGSLTDKRAEQTHHPFVTFPRFLLLPLPSSYFKKSCVTFSLKAACVCVSWRVRCTLLACFIIISHTLLLMRWKKMTTRMRTLLLLNTHSFWLEGSKLHNFCLLFLETRGGREDDDVVKIFMQTYQLKWTVLDLHSNTKGISSCFLFFLNAAFFTFRFFYLKKVYISLTLLSIIVWEQRFFMMMIKPFTSERKWEHEMNKRASVREIMLGFLSYHLITRK